MQLTTIVFVGAICAGSVLATKPKYGKYGNDSLNSAIRDVVNIYTAEDKTQVQSFLGLDTEAYNKIKVIIENAKLPVGFKFSGNKLAELYDKFAKIIVKLGNLDCVHLVKKNFAAKRNSVKGKQVEPSEVTNYFQNQYGMATDTDVNRDAIISALDVLAVGLKDLVMEQLTNNSFLWPPEDPGKKESKTILEQFEKYYAIIHPGWSTLKIALIVIVIIALIVVAAAVVIFLIRRKNAGTSNV